MKKIFLMCFCTAVFTLFSFIPVFSAQSDDVKNEVNRVKLEAKQKVKQIKAEAKALRIKAKADAKQAKIDEKNARINAAKEAKKATKTAEFNAKMTDIKAKNDAQKAAVIEAAAGKKSKIDAIANAKLLKIEEENNKKIAALRAKYEDKGSKNTVKAEKITPVSELKPRAIKETEKEPVINYAHNYAGLDFEGEKAEITSVLELTEKQQAKAEKIYTKAKEKIAVLNKEINDKHKEAKMVKMSKIDTKTQLSRLNELNEELDILYYSRDKIHNNGLKKFEKILNKEQEKIWYDIKIRGARFFPPVDSINIENPPQTDTQGGV